MNVIRFAIEATLLSAVAVLHMAPVTSAKSVVFGRPVEDEATATNLRHKPTQIHRKLHQKRHPSQLRATRRKGGENHSAHRELPTEEESTRRLAGAEKVMSLSSMPTYMPTSWPTYSPTDSIDAMSIISSPTYSPIDSTDAMSIKINSETLAPSPSWPTYSPTISVDEREDV